MYFSFIITNLAGGGAEKIVLTLAEGLSKRGHQIDVILLEDYIEHNIPPNLNIIVLKKTTSKSWLSKRYLARLLKKHIASNNHKTPDIIISALPFANEVSILANLPRLWCRIDNTLGVEIEKLAAINPRKARRRLRRYRYLYTGQRLIAISHGMIDDLHTVLGDGHRITLIPNPFDFSAINIAASEQVSGLPTKPYVIHVGRFNRQKRHDRLLDVWERVNTDRILVLLTAHNSELQAMINERGLSQRIIIVGFQPNPYPWIANADLLVLTSDHEGLPGVLIEALACDTPAVSTDCPSGPKEILADYPECLVPLGKNKSLVAAIEQCIKSPPKISHTSITPYSIDRVLDAYERLANTPDR